MAEIDGLQVSEADLEVLYRLFLEFLPDRVVWAYGSRVDGRANLHSDLDLVVFCQPHDRLKLMELR